MYLGKISSGDPDRVRDGTYNLGLGLRGEGKLTFVSVPSFVKHDARRDDDSHLRQDVARGNLAVVFPNVDYSPEQFQQVAVKIGRKSGQAERHTGEVEGRVESHGEGAEGLLHVRLQVMKIEKHSRAASCLLCCHA